MRKNLLRLLKDFLWVLAIAGGVLGLTRFAFGLGASTNMLDSLPWGWWKVFNMVAGAALATSGFIIAAVIYILQLERFRPVARLSVLVGFLGYGSSLAALNFDIGLPHRGWHAFFMWNPHSFLFEVFWCVSAYWGVTALELLPLVTERFKIPKITHLIHEVMLPFVVLGVTLSTMHHSSLGSLFMAAPTRLHPLWYSLWIPPEFLVSAMGAGLCTMVLLYTSVSWLTGRKADKDVAATLAAIGWGFLLLYGIIKVADFTLHDKWVFLGGEERTWESLLWEVEFTFQVIIPVVVLALPSMRRKNWALLVGCGSALLGLTSHRLSTGIFGFFSTARAVYIPAPSELVLSFGVLAAAGLMLLFLVERFNILEEPGEVKPEGAPTNPFWSLAEARSLFLGFNARRVAKMAILVVPLTLYGFRHQGTGPFHPTEQPVYPSILAEDELRDELLINADRDDEAVLFPHELHKQKFQDEYGLAEDETCIKCHHLNVPEDKNSPCRACHKDMELPTPMFVRARHEGRFEKPEDREKFESYDLSDRHDHFQACFDCHEDNMEGLVDYEDKGFDDDAPGFRQAMHGNCMTCHRKEETEDDKKEPMSIGNCKGCHLWSTTEEAAHPEPDVTDLVQEGQDAYLTGDLVQAEERYRAALVLDPEHPTALYHLGVLLKVTGRTDEAIAVLGQAAVVEDHVDAERAQAALDMISAEAPHDGADGSAPM